MKNLLVLTVAAMGWCTVWTTSADAAPANGVCRDPYTCPKVYKPVCDNFGQIFSNSCQMEAASCRDGVPRVESPCPKVVPRQLAKSGRVFDCKNAFVCPKIYQPVCDSEGRVYSSPCMMHSYGCEEGKPRVEAPCPSSKFRRLSVGDFYPWMVSKGGDDAKKPEMRDGDVEENPQCRKRCFKIYAPVCGTDGFKHSNTCMMEYKACTTKTEIKAVSCTTRKSWEEWVPEEDEEGVEKRDESEEETKEEDKKKKN